MLFIQIGIAALQLQAFNKLKPAEVILFPEPMPWAVVGGSGVRRVVGGGGLVQVPAQDCGSITPF